MTSSGTAGPRTTTGARGKQGYRAPELLQENDAKYTKKVDVWSIGCILSELCIGKRTFNSDWSVMKFVLSTNRSFGLRPTWIPSGQPWEILDSWIKEMLEPDYQLRPSVDALCTKLAGLIALVADPPDHQYFPLIVKEQPTLLLQAGYLLGCDLPMQQEVPQWEDLFEPGSFGSHSGLVERYKTVLNARKIILGSKHQMTRWSEICFIEASRLLKLEYPILLLGEGEANRKRYRSSNSIYLTKQADTLSQNSQRQP